MTLTITRMENGQVSLQGPISDQLLCYGLLEVARDAVKQFNDDRKKQAPKIEVPSPGMVAVLNR